MSSNHVILIHGTWCNGGNWGEFAVELERRGYTVHTPTYRYHGKPGDIDVWGNAEKVRKLGLLDYVEDFAALVDTLDSPPIVIGHSVGGLLAQLLAARRKTRGLVLLGPGPAAGMHTFYPAAIRLWARYLPEWLLGKPMYPVNWDIWQKYVCNAQTEEVAAAYYATLCAESGTAYREMIFWYLDSKRASRVDYGAVNAPVLVIGGSEDKCTPPGMCSGTARRFGHNGTYVELKGSDHMMTVGKYMPQTLDTFDKWTAENGIQHESLR